MSEDAELLHRYVTDQSEAAFTELIRRNVDLVYSAALRLVNGDVHRAEDVTQQVFAEFARQAKRLTRHPAITGWLYTTTRLIALRAIRTEQRRTTREREAHTMNELLRQPDPETDWNELRPVLEDAMHELGDDDRHAVLLRFFRNKNLREVGAALGLNENAARMRVDRALDKLRGHLARRGITTTAGALSIAISTNAVQAAPAGLTVTISTAATLAGTTLAATTTATVTKAVAMTALQKTLVTATVAVIAGAGIYQGRQAAQLREQNRTLQQRQVTLAEQIQQLQSDRDEATNRLAGALADNLRLKSSPDQSELLRLRAELAQLRNEGGDPTAQAAKAMEAKVKWLKQQLEQMPDKKIPELQFITGQDWAEAIWDMDLDTTDGVREALSKVRDRAESIFLGTMMQAAFKKYLAANNDILPADLSQLKPYFDVPVTDAMLQRYQLLQTGKTDHSADLVKLVTYVDEDYDSDHHMSIHGSGGSRFNKVQQAVGTAAGYFSADHEGRIPDQASQIAPYLKMRLDTATVQKYLNQYQQERQKIIANPPSPEVITLAPALKNYAEAHNGEYPKNPSDLRPYLTTPEQQAALQRLEQNNPASK